MADQEREERKKRLAAFLAPYRGRCGELAAKEGHLGLGMLHELFSGNAQQAAEYLGYSRDKKGWVNGKQVRENWARFGLKAEGNVKVRSGYEEGESVGAIRERYLSETSRRELVPVVTWKLPVENECGVCVCVSDLHCGPREMDYVRWLKVRDWIREDKTRRWMYLGDAMDVPTRNSPTERNYLSQDETERLLEDDFEKIAGQCFCILSGNHENRLARETGVQTLDPLGRIAEKLEIYYGGLETGLRVRVQQGKRSEEYDGYLHHGVSGATTLGGQLSALERAVRNFEVEFLVFGHTHARLVAEVERMMLCRESEKDEDGREWAEVKYREIVMAYAGSFLRHTSGGYSRNKLLAPANLGSIALHFFGSRHAVHGRK